MKFTYRKYQPGDEIAINELYHAVTGRTRTVEQHAWQWLQTPAGESEMWLIEAKLDNGQTKLIGHHGIMALEFSYKGMPVRVGKTENTMVLPNFREKILYPRYEKIFLSHYENKFYALFSTTGPNAAIRVRKAMGYEAKHQWHNIFIGKEPFISLSLLNSFVTQKLGKQFSNLIKDVPNNLVIEGTKIEAFIGHEISTTFDFDNFWSEISHNYPLTPTRTKKNISWKYWENPYQQHITLIMNNEILGVAVCIISLRKQFCAYVDDIYCDDISNLPRFLEIVHTWARKALGVYMLEFQTTTDTIKYFQQTNSIKYTSWIHQLHGIIKPEKENLMPRKITNLGKELLIAPEDDWFVTPYFFEGR